MRRLLNKPWFVATLALGAVALIGVQTFSVSGARRLTPVDEPEEMNAGVEAQDRPGTEAILALLSTYTPADTLRDPFVLRAEPTAGPVVAEAAPAPKEAFRLSAVWVQGASTLAVLNDRICSPGESLGQLTLESVNPTGAWVLHAHGREFVAVGQELLLAPANQPLPPAPLLARGEI